MTVSRGVYETSTDSNDSSLVLGDMPVLDEACKGDSFDFVHEAELGDMALELSKAELSEIDMSGWLFLLCSGGSSLSDWVIDLMA